MGEVFFFFFHLIKQLYSVSKVPSLFLNDFAVLNFFEVVLSMIKRSDQDNL